MREKIVFEQGGKNFNQTPTWDSNEESIG